MPFVPMPQWRSCRNLTDTENEVQLSLMYNHFCFTMPVVTFWMNHFVFPDATDQFPSHRSTSAGNLTEGGQTRGFSGTDDTRFLLPLEVEQVLPVDPELRSTNGAMIDRILACTRDVITMKDSGETSLWHEIVSRALTLGMSALIDVAGLMAGSVNSEVATYMASLLEHTAQNEFRGIVYFDVEWNAWAVYELENKCRVHLKISSLEEADCFVYFDQSRCRGADMKLRKDARALVTLEPNLPKDKFLQGCMRMRNLREGGQSLVLAGTSEFVTHKMGTKEVLEKILHNTVRMIQQGLVTYFERGMTYYSFPNEIKEEVGLKKMYAHALSDHEDLKAFLESSYEVEAMSTSKQKLVEYCKSMGEGVDAQVSRLAAECEQELEKEVEQEEEEELQLPVENPYSEVDWAYEKAFSDPGFLFTSKTFIPVQELLDRHVPTLSSVNWSDKMFCTLNFFRVIVHNPACTNLAHYLRPVNTILTLEDARVVLLSEYEADKLLPLWRSSTLRTYPTLLHLCMVVNSKNQLGFGRDFVSPDSSVLTSLKLFRGYVHFSRDELRTLTAMFETVQARSFIQNLLSIRGRLRFFDRSDLDGFSTIMGG
jgi:hypothetical protein